MKRAASFLLCLALLLTLFPAAAFAAGETSGSKLIALTFDDGPSAYTEELLDGLKARGARVTFFCVGFNIVKRPETVKRAWTEGHQIANHTWNHPELTSITSDAVKSQISRVEDALDEAVGFHLSYIFRPPYGSYSQRVLSAANVPGIYWSMNTADYLTSKADVVCSQIVKAARDGAIGCLHDTHYSTVKGALMAIDKLQKEGYEFVTINELFYRKGLTLENATIYKNAYKGSDTAPALKAPEITSVEDPATGKQKITISGDERGSVYYTTDGSVPSPINGRLYTGAFMLSSDAAVRAVSVVNWNGLRSYTSELKVEVTPRADLFSAPDGSRLVLSSSAQGAKIYFTDDGSKPDSESTLYVSPIEGVPGTTYSAVATADRMRDSATEAITYSDSGFWMRDVKPGDWYYGVIDEAAFLGILNGTGNFRYQPGKSTTRAMAITMLYRLASPAEDFERIAPDDVAEGKYYYDAVSWAYSAGIEDGIENGFRPNEDITKEELAVMLARLLGAEEGADTSLLAEHPDGGEVSEWAERGVAACLELGILRGNSSGKLKPQKGASRAETAAMLLRAAEIMKG